MMLAAEAIELLQKTAVDAHGFSVITPDNEAPHIKWMFNHAKGVLDRHETTPRPLNLMLGGLKDVVAAVSKLMTLPAFACVERAHVEVRDVATRREVVSWHPVKAVAFKALMQLQESDQGIAFSLNELLSWLHITLTAQCVAPDVIAGFRQLKWSRYEKTNHQNAGTAGESLSTEVQRVVYCGDTLVPEQFHVVTPVFIGEMFEPVTFPVAVLIDHTEHKIILRTIGDSVHRALLNAQDIMYDELVGLASEVAKLGGDLTILKS